MWCRELVPSLKNNAEQSKLTVLNNSSKNILKTLALTCTFFAQNLKNVQRFCVWVGCLPLSCTVYGLEIIVPCLCAYLWKLVYSCKMAIKGFANLFITSPSRYPLPISCYHDDFVQILVTRSNVNIIMVVVLVEFWFWLIGTAGAT